MRGGRSSPCGRGTPSSGVQLWQSGSSPCGRGTRKHARHCGNPVHPRVGGEHQCHISMVAQRFIPVWAGNTAINCGLWQSGSSPCGRGTRKQLRVSICAVHPRVGGEHVQTCVLISQCGSSPCGRGTLDRQADMRQSRFIPVWAGNTWRYTARAQVPVHPRVGGEHANICVMNRKRGSSPCGRGTRKQLRLACGNPVHPRVGGEHCKRCGPVAIAVHPRVGGEHLIDAISRQIPARFIPVWAGNTLAGSH